MVSKKEKRQNMSRRNYLSALRHELQALSDLEREEAIKYYADYFEDAELDTEAQIIAEFGTPKELAKIILNNFPGVPQSLNKNKEEKTNKETKSVAKKDTGDSSKAAKILLLILLVLITIPVWMPIFTAICGIVLGLIFASIGVGIVFVIASVAVLLVGIFFSIYGICALFVGPLTGMLICGLGLLLEGLGIIFVLASVWLCSKLIPAVIRGIVWVFRRPFAKKEASV